MAYPPGPERVAALPNYGANSAPTDRIHIVSAATGFTAGVASDNYITPTDFLAEITRNITDKSLAFGGGSVATVSAANKGKLAYDQVLQRFKYSENGAAYKLWITPAGPTNAVQINNGAFLLDGDAGFTYDIASQTIVIGSSSAVGNLKWRGTGVTNGVTFKVNSPTGNYVYTLPDGVPAVNQFLQATAVAGVNVTLGWTTVAGTSPGSPVNSLQWNSAGTFAGLSGSVVSGSNLGLGATPDSLFTVAAQTTIVAPVSGTLVHLTGLDANSLRVTLDTHNNAGAGGTAFLFRRSRGTAAAPSAVLANDTIGSMNGTGYGATGYGAASTGLISIKANQNFTDTAMGTFIAFFTTPDASVSAAEVGRFTSSGLTLGVASTLTGNLVLSVSGSANTTALQAATAPGATLIYRLPATSPSANQVLSASAPSGGIVTTTWVTALSPNAPNFSVQINGGGGAFDSNGQFTYDTATNTVLIGSSSALGSLKFRDTTTSNGVTLKVSAPSGNHVYTLPDGLPSLNQFLQATAVSGVNVTLGWTTVSSGTTINPTDTVMPVRSNATTFIDSNLSLVAGVTALTVSSAAAFAVGAGGNTNPVLRVVTNVASQAAGISITGNAAGAGVTLTVLSSGTNENLFLVPKGTGSILFNSGGGGVYESTNNRLGVGVNDFSGSPSSSVVKTQNLHLVTAATIIGSSATNTAADISLLRSAAGVWRIGNGSTAIGSLLIANSSRSVTGNFTVLGDNAATATAIDVARFGLTSTGTAAAGFGGIITFGLASSTTADQTAGNQTWFWQNATHATRSAAISWSVVNNATVTQYMNLSPAGGGGTFVGTTACLSVYEGTAPSVWTAGAFAAKLYLISAAGTPATGVAANFSTTSTASPAWMMLRGRGTNASPAVVTTGDQLGEIQYCGHTNTSTNNFAYGALIRVTATETWSGGATGCDMFFHTSVTGGTVAEKMSLRNTGTLRIGATSGTFNTTTLLQVGNYASWNTVVAAFYTGANGTPGVEIIGTSGQTANPFRVFLDAGATLFTIFPSGAFSSTALTVATLPSAATVGAGGRSFVTDSSTTVILGLGLTVVGGGANKVPVYSDGTNWIIG